MTGMPSADWQTHEHLRSTHPGLALCSLCLSGSCFPKWVRTSHRHREASLQRFLSGWGRPAQTVPEEGGMGGQVK